MKLKKRLFILLALCMALSLTPAAVFAVEDEEQAAFKFVAVQREIVVGNINDLINGKVKIENEAGTWSMEFTQAGDCLADEGQVYKLFFIADEQYELDEKTVVIFSLDDGSETAMDLDYDSDNDCYSFTVPTDRTDNYEIQINCEFKIKEAPAPATYTVTVRRGTADKYSATEGEFVTITANEPEIGKHFTNWTGVNNLNFADGSNATTATATFAMPARAVQVTANYESEWVSLQNEIDEAENNATITLTNSVTALGEDTSLVVPGGKTLTIDLKGYTLDRGLSSRNMQTRGYVIIVRSGATLTIRDGIVTGGGNRGSGGGIYVEDGGALNLTNVAVQGNYSTEHGAGIYLAGSAQCSAADSSVNNNRTTVNTNGSGGGIYLTSGTLQMTDCSVSKNQSQNLAGGIYIESGSAELTGCEINSNDAYANACGGGMFLSGGSLILDDCEVCGNTSSKDNPHGIGVFVNVGATFIVSGKTKITDNKYGTKQLNVFLHNGAVIIPKGLADTAAIGVAVGKTNSSYVAEYRAGAITAGLPDNGSLANFTSDISTYTVGMNTDGEAILYNKPTVTISGVTGSFNDKIKLNYYFDIPEAMLADQSAYVTLTNESNGKTITLPIKDAQYATDRGYRFSIPLAAKEAGDTITARVFDGQGSPIEILSGSKTDYTATGVQYTLMQYFDWLENNGTDSEKAIGTAAKDYCAAAQIYFKYNEDGVAVSSAVDAVTAETLSGYIAVREGSLPTGVSIRGITAMLESDNTLRLYLGFDDESDPNSFTYTIDKGTDNEKVVSLRQRADGSYYLALDAGVYSDHLQDEHTYSISDNTNTYTITASVLTYARSCVIKSKGTEAEKNLGKAIYLYNRAAVSVFGE